MYRWKEETALSSLADDTDVFMKDVHVNVLKRVILVRSQKLHGLLWKFIFHSSHTAMQLAL